MEAYDKWRSALSLDPVENTNRPQYAQPNANLKRNYIGNIVYENNYVKRILFDNGYFENGNYYFYLRDHLGNNSVVVDANGVVKQRLYYYPYGKVVGNQESYAEGFQPYKFGGKEDEPMFGLGLYDFEARQLDPAVGRFTTVDPLAEKYYSISPYAYCLNNPINRIDPDGRADFWVNGKVVGNDGVDDQRVLAVRTEALTKKEVKETTKFIKANSGNAEAFQNNGMAYTNSIAIESSADNRQAMVTEVSKDNGKGGTADANNREYGGSIENGKVVAATPGAVANPSVDESASIMLPVGNPTFHSHPSGTRSEVVKEGTRNSWFNQPPSTTDKDNAGTHTNYVFGRGNGKVYIYTSSGVHAVIPFKQFVNPKR
ncbi:RHS repeat domain-containing protein [Viscerimonas tarda]